MNLRTLLVAITIASLGMSAVAGPAAAAIDIGPIDPPDPGEIDIDVDPDVDTSGGEAGASAGAVGTGSGDVGVGSDAGSGSSSGGETVVVASGGVATGMSVSEVQAVSDTGQGAADSAADAAGEAAKTYGETISKEAQLRKQGGEVAVEKAESHPATDEAVSGVAAVGVCAATSGGCAATGVAYVAQQGAEELLGIDHEGDTLSQGTGASTSGDTESSPETSNSGSNTSGPSNSNPDVGDVGDVDVNPAPDVGDVEVDAVPDVGDIDIDIDL